MFPYSSVQFSEVGWVVYVRPERENTAWLFSECSGNEYDRFSGTSIVELWWLRIKQDWYIDGLMQERHNSCASAMELRLSRTNPSMCPIWWSFIVMSSIRSQQKFAHTAIAPNSLCFSYFGKQQLRVDMYQMSFGVAFVLCVQCIPGNMYTLPLCYVMLWFFIHLFTYIFQGYFICTA